MCQMFFISKGPASFRKYKPVCSVQQSGSSISVVMTMVPMLLRQFRRFSQGHWSYANSLKQLFLQLHLGVKKHIQQFSTCLLEIQVRFVFLVTYIKMSDLLHGRLMLIISKVFTILCLLCLCRNREYPGNFQNKTGISKLFFQMSAQVK